VVTLAPGRGANARQEELTMGLKIIGSGFGRTGTMSLKRALEELAFGPATTWKNCLCTPSKFSTGKG